MNIVQIISHSYLSGASRHLLILAAALQRQGHVVTLLCPPGEWLPARARAIGVDVRETPMRSLRSWVEMGTVARYVRAHRADVVHTHTTRGAMIGFLLGLLCGIPVVASVHTHSRDIVYRRLIPRGRNRVAAVSNFVRDALIAQGAPETHIQTIYNGTDCLSDDNAWQGERDTEAETGLEHHPPFASVRAELKVPPDAQLIGVFGYISALKGQELLAQAAPQIIAQCPRAHFVFVGPLVSPQIQQQITERAEQAGIGNRLHLIGYRADVTRLMDAMDIVAVPSRIEACSMVTLEAMARGRPIVAARVGGMSELVTHTTTGLLVEREAGAFADAIIALLQAPADRAGMGYAGRTRVRAHFTSTRMASQFEALYQDMAGNTLSH